MASKSVARIAILIPVFILGCSGNNANMKSLSESESDAIQQELLDNWPDYNIRYNQAVIVFDPKDDNKKIIVDNYWSTVKDQKTWTQLVNGTMIVSNQWGFNDVWGEPIREIWVHNQFYGYVCHPQRVLVTARIEDEKTIRVFQQGGMYRTYR